MNAYHEPVIVEGDRRCSAVVPDDEGNETECRLLAGEHEQPTVWRAWLDTRHFSFEGFGVTEEDARAALVEALTGHGLGYELDPDWYHEFLDDAGTFEYRLGVGYRDHEEV